MKFLKQSKNGVEEDTVYYICRNANNSGDYEANLTWYAIGAVYTSEQQNNTKYPWFRYEDYDNKNGGLLNLSDSIREPGKEYNYDNNWSNDLYPSLTISEMNPDYKEYVDADGNAAEKTVWFMEQHVGDWAYPDYTANMINEN